MAFFGWLCVYLLLMALGFVLGFKAALGSVAGVIGKLENEGLLTITNAALREQAHRKSP